MAKCLVTGGAGFIGSHLTDKLIELGHQVLVIDNLMLGKREFVNHQAQFHQVDIRNFDEIKPLFQDVEAVFHLAADPRLPLSVEDPISTHDINVSGTLHVLKASLDNSVKKVIFSSTCAVYGDQEPPIKEDYRPEPKSPYGLHKLMGEKYMKLFSELYNLHTVSLRYFNVYGPRKLAEGGYPMVIPVFLGQKKKKQPLTIIGDGKQTRDYVHVSDVVKANIKAWQSEVNEGEAINIGSGEQISVNQIAEMISGETVNIPERAGEMRFIEADISKAKKILDWEPTITFEQGLNQLMQ